MTCRVPGLPGESESALIGVWRRGFEAFARFASREARARPMRSKGAVGGRSRESTRR
jgi:hypothetical protein